MDSKKRLVANGFDMDSNKKWLADNGFGLERTYSDGSMLYVKKAREDGGSAYVSVSSVSVFLPAESSQEKRVCATVEIDGNEFSGCSDDGIAAFAVPRAIKAARRWLDDLRNDLDIMRDTLSYEG